MYLELIPGLIIRVVRSELIWVAGWIELHLCPKYDVLQSNKLFYKVLRACFPPINWNFWEMISNTLGHIWVTFFKPVISTSISLFFFVFDKYSPQKMVWRTAGFRSLLIFISFIEIYLLGQTSCRVLSLLTL